MSHIIADADARTEFAGLYFEEVSKLVDGIESEILGGTLKTQGDAREQLSEHIFLNEWTEDNANLSVHVLLWSKHACAGIRRDEFPDPEDYGVDESFPFSHFAKVAMRADCMALLQALPAYRALPDP